MCHTCVSQGPGSGVVFAGKNKEPRDAKEEGVEGVDERVDDVQICEGEGG